MNNGHEGTWRIGNLVTEEEQTATVLYSRFYLEHVQFHCTLLLQGFLSGLTCRTKLEIPETTLRSLAESFRAPLCNIL